jgi:rubrerythrin
MTGRRRITSLNHNANYTLQVAIELERRGLTFYDSLALGCGNSEVTALATALARAEEEHIVTFKRMWNALPEELSGPRLTDEELLAATEELRIKIMPNARKVLDLFLNSDLCKALDMAIEMEVEAVAFYSGLASAIANLDATVLKGVVSAEMEHLNMLREMRKRISA